MLNVIAVCSGNTCRSPLFGAALRLLSDTVSVRTACAPNYEEDDSRPLECMPKPFKDAASLLIALGIVDRAREARLPNIVSELTHHKATLFEDLTPQPIGDEVFVAAADKHKKHLEEWAAEIGRSPVRIEVAGISDFAWKVYRLQLTLKGICPEKASEMEPELSDAYRALATLTILRALEVFPELRRNAA